MDKKQVLTHNLEQQESYLRAALEQEKKSVGFFVGAGAPMSMKIDDKFLIPGLAALTNLVLTECDITLRPSLTSLVSHLPVGDQQNLEVILNYIRALLALPGHGDVRGLSVEVLADVDKEVTRIIRKYVNADLPSGDTPYASLAVWIGSVRRLAPTQIFTTNYDLLLEQSLERQRVAYFDGFVGSREPSFDLQAIEEDQLPNRWTLLWKLHGSINWFQETSGNVIRKPILDGDESSALVYPSHLKYDQSRRLPYLAMMDRLKAFLRRPGAVLITTGFSFKDQHINEVLDQSLRTNPTASVQALLYGELDNYAEAGEIARNLPNLVLIARDAGYVGTRRAPWGSLLKDDGSEEPAASELGDFKVFGDFLRELTGSLGGEADRV